MVYSNNSGNGHMRKLGEDHFDDLEYKRMTKGRKRPLSWKLSRRDRARARPDKFSVLDTGDLAY